MLGEKQIMRLSNILIINRAPFERLKLNCDDSNIFVLLGINGSGKTTIISHIVDSFYELAKLAFYNEFADKQNKYYRLSSNLYSLDNTKPSIVYLRYTMDDGTIADYIDARDLHDEQQYTAAIALEKPISFSLIKNELNSNGTTKYWTLSDSDAIGRIFNSAILTYFPAYRYEMPSYLHNLYKISLQYKLSSDYSGYLPNPIEVTSDLPQIANWIMDVVLDLQVSKGTAISVVNQLSHLLTYILSSKVGRPARLGIGPRNMAGTRISIMDSERNTLIYPTIFNMSSGELALLCLFGELIKQSDRIRKQMGNISGIVLVDEVEKHLHIGLQKAILPKLFSMFPKIQFIVSSHSPYLGVGLQEEKDLSYEIFDLDNNGIPLPPQQTHLFSEAYETMIDQNQRFAEMYQSLLHHLQTSSKPLILTEGKSDWKHLASALRELKIDNLEIEFYRYEGTLGDTVLLQLLKDYARIPQARKIIGIFDRDNFDKLKYDELESSSVVEFGNNVYGFSIPCAHVNQYGSFTSIEHYYKKDDLLKWTNEGKRLFLGQEFYESGKSRDGKYETRIKEIQNKIRKNGIVDDKVYSRDDLEQKDSIALSKNAFAQMIYDHEQYAEDFDFSEFNSIFNIIREICQM